MGSSSCQRIGEARGEEPQAGEITGAVRLPGGVAFRWETAGAGALILAALGCASVPSVLLQVHDLAELQQWAAPGCPIGYRGCDDTRHYFLMRSGVSISLPLHGWHVTAMPVTLGWCIPLMFEADRLIVPPREWSINADLHSLQWALRE